MVHPVNDRFKVKKDNPGRFGDPKAGSETGIVVEVPDTLIYLSFHSFAFEDSLVSKKLEELQKYYGTFLNKRIYWEALQDRGRVIKEGDDEFVYLQMTDLLAYADDVGDTATVVDQTGTAGSFNLS